MNKKILTGRTFTPEQYRKMSFCVGCGIIIKSKCKNLNCKFEDKPCSTHYCEDCIKIVFENCFVCKMVLRDGPFKSYTYDIKNHKRDNGVEFKVNKVLVREFVYYREPSTKRYGKNICESCIGFKDKIKHKCFNCESCFSNTNKHYIENGNTCKPCAIMFDEVSRIIWAEELSFNNHSNGTR